MEEQIKEVLKLARSKGVSFSLTYDEGDDTWYWHISSAAPSERFIGHNSSSFDFATKEVIKWLMRR